MTLIPSDAAGKAINRESIFELLPRHPLPSETVASWRNEYFNTCERISSRHHLLPPFFLIYIYIYIHTHTPAFPYGFNTEEHLSLSCTLHSSSVAQLNRPARVRLLARCDPSPPPAHSTVSLPPPFPFSRRRGSRGSRLARGSSNGPWRGRVLGNAVRIPARIAAR